MPDGQNFREKGTGTPNLNFTLFIPRYFQLSKKQIYTQVQSLKTLTKDEIELLFSA